MRRISEFENMSRRLHADQDAMDSATLQRLQEEVEEAWNYLLLVDPIQKENAYSLIEFFLGKIEDDPEDELVNEQCKWKILALARSLADNPTNINHSGIHHN